MKQLFPPTAADFGNQGDEWYAREHFLGTTLEQARTLFRQNPLYYLDDLIYMSVRAFCYFVPAAIDYVLSPEADDDFIAMQTLVGRIAYWHEHDPKGVADQVPDLLAALRVIRSDSDRFYNRTIYPNWRSLASNQTFLNELDQLITSMEQRPPRPTKRERREQASGPRRPRPDGH